ncbi:MAG: threonylcarbamoyl-AMP synthase [Bacteroidota bacterium]|nr:threonylcarbamoyl-AMP synthase [Bacteroidota bacterium]
MPSTRLLKVSSSNYASVLAEASRAVRERKVVIYPTDTIYGIGGDAAKADVVEKIYSLKERDRGKPLLVLMNSVGMVNNFVEEIPPVAKRLVEKYWPGAVTFVFKANKNLPRGLTGETGTIGIRIPHHLFCVDLIAAAGVPMISTSANLSGTAGGEKIKDVIEEFNGKVDVIVDGGDAASSLPSTVVDVTGNQPRIVRAGAVKVELA